MARDVEDTICLHVQVSVEVEQDRWWRIEQPPPSIALTLRGRIGAALGPAADQALLLMFRGLDPQGAEDVEQDEQSVGDALALATFRRARSGRSVVVDDEPADVTAGRLLAVAAFIGRRTGAGVDSVLLLGEHERREKGQPGYKWPRPALLYRLLMDSKLCFGGWAERARWPSGTPDDEAPGAALMQAQLRGSVGEFIEALDKVVAGPDELLLLVSWALLHLWRPF